MVGIGAVAAIADDDDDDTGGGVPLIVTVRTAVPSPTPSATSTPRPTPTPSRSAGSTTSSSSPGGSAPSSSAAPADEELTTLPFEDLGGVLYVSGLSTRYLPSLDPGAGQIFVHFTVRNVSETTVDSYAVFRLSTVFGQPLSEVGPTMVLRLEPHETRTVRAVLLNAGQWAFETATFKLVPTSLVDDERVPSMTRDTFVFFVPWLLVVILAFALALFAVVRWLRYRQGLLVEEPG